MQFRHQQNYQEEQDEEMKQMFNESEKVLNILRTQQARPIQKATEKEVIEWNQNIRQLNPQNRS
jgi:hypothetical protein